MIDIDIPGHGELHLAHLVCDYNGTVAAGGHLLPGVEERLRTLADRLAVHIVTAATFGETGSALAELPLRLSVLDEAKKDYARGLGSSGVATLGNGRNDRLLLREADLGIGVLEVEGACFETLAAVDLVSRVDRGAGSTSRAAPDRGRFSSITNNRRRQYLLFPREANLSLQSAFWTEHANRTDHLL